MALNPPIKGPITDLNRILPNSSEYQAVPRCHCALVETRYMECMDSYGLDLSRYKCNQYREDWLECINYTKQLMRARIIRRERYRQFIMEGKKPLYGNSPAIDAHLY